VSWELCYAIFTPLLDFSCCLLASLHSRDTQSAAINQRDLKAGDDEEPLSAEGGGLWSLRSCEHKNVLRPQGKKTRGQTGRSRERPRSGISRVTSSSPFAWHWTVTYFRMTSAKFSKHRRKRGPQRGRERGERIGVKSFREQLPQVFYLLLLFASLLPPASPWIITSSSRQRGLICHAQVERASEKSREQALKELAEPLLDEALIRDVILSWTRPLPSSYLTSPLVLVGPSGVGKNRLVKYLRKDYNKFFAKVVTHTTRQPRSEEINGTHYHFVTPSQFAEMVQGEAFLEHSVVHGRNSYGLSMEAYKKVAQQGKIAIFEVDVQGARKLRAGGLAELHNLTPRYIFIAPTSIEMLRERLLQRGTEDDADIAIRLETAAQEIEASKSESGLFDRVLVNEDLEKTAHALFRAARDWYPALPSPARLRMLQRRLSKIKQLGSEAAATEKAPDGTHHTHSVGDASQCGKEK